MPPPKPPRGFDQSVPTVLPRLSDLSASSVTRALAEAFAQEYAALHAQMQAIYDSAFVDTATGDDLDALAKLLAFQRRRIESLHNEAEGAVLALREGKPKKRKTTKKRRRST